MYPSSVVEHTLHVRAVVHGVGFRFRPLGLEVLGGMARVLGPEVSRLNGLGLRAENFPPG